MKSEVSIEIWRLNVSILYPADDPDPNPGRRRRAHTRGSVPFLDRLLRPGFLQHMLNGTGKSGTHVVSPPGRIRLVTSRWIDRPQKTRAKDQSRPPG